MNPALLTEIINHQKEPCVAMVVSTAMKSFADKEKIQLELKNSLNQVSKSLQAGYDETVSTELIDSMRSLIEQVDWDHLPQGLGFYVSPGYSRLVSFPFPVSDNISIDKVFNVSHIRENLNKMTPYTVVLLSRNHTRLFSGKGRELTEIKDQHFPKDFENEYQVHRASPHSLYNNEESKIDHSRWEQYFREIDKLLGAHTGANPVVLIGVKENLSIFKSVYKSPQQVIEEIVGNFDKATVPEIKDLVLPAIDAYQQRENKLQPQ